MVLQILTLIGALGMFLYGMNTMSSGLQKAAGEKLRNFLAAMTSNPVKGVLTGLGITAIIQSSSATTVMHHCDCLAHFPPRIQDGHIGIVHTSDGSRVHLFHGQEEQDKEHRGIHHRICPPFPRPFFHERVCA